MPDLKDNNNINARIRYNGFVSIDSNNIDMSKTIPYTGPVEDFKKIIKTNKLDSTLMTIREDHPKKIDSIISTLQESWMKTNLCTATTPVLNDKIQDEKLKNILYYSLQNNDIPEWQKIIKSIYDYIFAILIFIMSLPLLLFIYAGIKLTSTGPVIYTQERLGKNKKPFIIYKFRTMYIDAEKDGHQLSYSNDPRITPIGKYLRKWHIDEIPQIINILKGEMSLIGPRPEREFYVNQILQEAPHYNIIFSVKPGITSWGMVKFGYAQNIEEMLERLKYDITYMKNRTLLSDCKIFFHTFKSVILGDGK